MSPRSTDMGRCEQSVELIAAQIDGVAADLTELAAAKEPDAAAIDAFTRDLFHRIGATLTAGEQAYAEVAGTPQDETPEIGNRP